MAKQPEWVETADRLCKRDQNALRIGGGERKTEVSDRQPCRASRLEERIWPGDDGVKDVGPRRRDPTRTNRASSRSSLASTHAFEGRMPKIRAAARLLDANEKSKCSTSPIGDTLRIAATITARRGLAERCAPLTPPRSGRLTATC